MPHGPHGNGDLIQIPRPAFQNRPGLSFVRLSNESDEVFRACDTSSTSLTCIVLVLYETELRVLLHFPLNTDHITLWITTPDISLKFLREAIPASSEPSNWSPALLWSVQRSGVTD
jgi:hypothetical protein